MIKIDNRIGSAELRKFLAGVPTELCRLDFGDFAFQGNGPGEMPYLIGIERKRISDLVQSMDSGRLSGHQLVGLTNSYNVIYLLVEGIWKPREDGVIMLPSKGGWRAMEYGKRRYTYHEVTNFLNSLTVLCGLNIFQTQGAFMSGLWLKHLYAWWRKPYSDHKSHLQFHQSIERQYAQLFVPPFIQRVAKELKGIGWDKSKALALKFKSVEELLNADVKTLMEIEGIGKKLAKQVYNQLRGIQ
jgi:ERCC4-type nuclease